MSTSYLLDSSILVLLLQQDTKINQRLAKIANGAFYVSIIALGELYYGAEHSGSVENSHADVDVLTRTMAVLNADNATARKYGLLKHQQRVKGLMLPDNDLDRCNGVTIWFNTYRKRSPFYMDYRTCF